MNLGFANPDIGNGVWHPLSFARLFFKFALLSRNDGNKFMVLVSHVSFLHDSKGKAIKHGRDTWLLLVISLPQLP